MILLDSLDELNEIVDEAMKEDEYVNDFTKFRVGLAQERNKLRLLNALMDSMKLSEEEAMKALGYAPAAVERCKQVVENLAQSGEKGGKLSDEKLRNEDLITVLGFIMTMGGGDDLQEMIDDLSQDDPNGNSSLSEVFAKHSAKRVAKAEAEQNQHAVKYLMQSMNLDEAQAECALGLAPE